MAVPSEPGKRPKAPATELPSKGDDTMSKYMESNMGEDDQESGGRAATGERPVIGLSRKRVLKGGPYPYYCAVPAI
jgi:hypothetical protein